MGFARRWLLVGMAVLSDMVCRRWARLDFLLARVSSWADYGFELGVYLDTLLCMLRRVLMYRRYRRPTWAVGLDSFGSLLYLVGKFVFAFGLSMFNVLNRFKKIIIITSLLISLVVYKFKPFCFDGFKKLIKRISSSIPSFSRLLVRSKRKLTPN